MDTDDLTRHDIELRAVRDGQLVVRYNAVDETPQSATFARHVSTRLPLSYGPLFAGGRVGVADLSATERRWLTVVSGALSNRIDFGGVDA